MKQGPDFAVVDGLRLSYEVLGNGPVCLVPSPGWGISVDFYRNTFAVLSDILTLVFIDTRGSGKSQRPPSTKDYRYADMAADLDGIRRALGAEKVWVLGHSCGGVLAMRYALDYPEAMAGLLLIGTFAESDEEYNRDVERRKKLRAHEPWYKEVDWDSISSDAELAAGLATALPLYFYGDPKKHGSVESFLGATYAIHPWKGWQDSEKCSVHLLDQLYKIRCPVFLSVGEHDFVCSPINSKRIQARIAGAELQVIPEAGHFQWLEQPKLFFPAIRRYISKHS